MNIKFSHKIGVSFTTIEEPGVIGLCHYAFGYRQIQLDSAFWKYSDSNQQLALAFHELTHCYCERNHDYKGQPYQKFDLSTIAESVNSKYGYLKDGCPASFMTPVITDGYCVQAHYGEYILEMFEGCNPY